MKPIFISAVILFMLTACGSAAPQVIVTPNVTVTSLPTAAPTFIPTMTFTPTPVFPQAFLDLGLSAEDYLIQGDKIVNKLDGSTVLVKNDKGDWVPVEATWL